MPKIDKATLFLVMDNAHELMEESTFLAEKKRYKRAFFLVYTGIEELEKTKVHLEDGVPFKNIKSHTIKSKLAQLNLHRFRQTSPLKEIKKKFNEVHPQIKEKFAQYETHASEDYKKSIEDQIKKLRDVTKFIEAVIKTGNVQDYREAALYVNGNMAENINEIFFRQLYHIHLDLFISFSEAIMNYARIHFKNGYVPKFNYEAVFEEMTKKRNKK